MEAVVSNVKRSIMVESVVFEEQEYDKWQGTAALYKSCELTLTI